MHQHFFTICLAFACICITTFAQDRKKRELLMKDKNLFIELRDNLSELEKRLDRRNCNGNPSSAPNDVGVTYTRWGKSTCPKNGAELVYSGWVGGSWYGLRGSAVNYLCMPKKPEWGQYKDGVSGYRGYVFGAEYEVHDGNIGMDRSSFHNYEVPCAVCRAVHSTSVLMTPAKTRCHKSWTKQYGGFLMTGKYNHEASAEYICVDGRPEKIGQSSNEDGTLLYPVEARCGSLPCGPYVNGRELTCVVCSK